MCQSIRRLALANTMALRMFDAFRSRPGSGAVNRQNVSNHAKVILRMAVRYERPTYFYPWLLILSYSRQRVATDSIMHGGVIGRSSLGQ